MSSDFSSNIHSQYVRNTVGFDDGDVALLSEFCYFLVDKQYISTQSSVLADLSSENDFFLEGRPVLCLDDSADDLALFLVALYDGISNKLADFSQIAILLRLSTKYSVNCMRKDLISALAIAYPSTLAQWDARERRFADSSYPHPSLVLQLAKEVQAPELMVSSLYDLSRNVPSRIAAGINTHLSQDDLYCTLKGRETASRFLSTFIVHELEGRRSASECTQARTCEMAFEGITFDLLRDINGLLCGRNSDVLFAISECVTMLLVKDERGVKRYDVCRFCMEEFERAVFSARNEMWYCLPRWFEVAVELWG